MSVETLKGMKVYIDSNGEYHLLAHAVEPPSADWHFVGLMHPHMVQGEESPPGSNIDLSGKATREESE